MNDKERCPAPTRDKGVEVVGAVNVKQAGKGEVAAGGVGLAY